MSAVIQATSVQPTRIASLPQAGSALLVIFGASGDLTRRKLIPGLYDLTCVGCVPRKFEVLGVGRTPMTTEEFRARMRQGALESGVGSVTLIMSSGRSLRNRLFYMVGDPSNTDFYRHLGANLEKRCIKQVRAQTIFFTCRRPPPSQLPSSSASGSAGLNRNDQALVAYRAIEAVRLYRDPGERETVPQRDGPLRTLR